MLHYPRVCEERRVLFIAVNLASHSEILINTVSYLLEKSINFDYLPYFSLFNLFLTKSKIMSFIYKYDNNENAKSVRK